MISFFSPAALHALGFIALLFMHSFCASTVTFQFTRDICKTAPFAKPSDGRRNAHLLRLQDAMLMKWRSRPAFMQTDFHASMKSVHKNVRVNCIIKRRPTILHCRPSNLSYSLLCVNIQNFYPVVIIAPRFRSPSGTFLHIASFF